MRTRSLLVLFIAAIATLGLATPAFAHDTVDTTSPGVGTVVSTEPENVALTFNEAVVQIGNDIVVNDTAGSNWADGDIRIDGNTVSVALKPAMPDGVYTVVWRVVSADGHPVSGSYVFGLGSESSLQAQVDAAQAQIIQPANDDGDAEASTTAVVTSASADNSWLVVGLGVAGALVAIGLGWSAFAIIRKRQR